MQRNKTQKIWKNEKSTFHFSINQKNAPKYLIRLIESLNRYDTVCVCVCIYSLLLPSFFTLFVHELSSVMQIFFGIF
jgi:hypothetical protein